MKKSIWIVVVLACFTFCPSGLVAAETKERSTTAGKKITSSDNAKKQNQKADESHQAASDSQKKTKNIIIPGKDLS